MGTATAVIQNYGTGWSRSSSSDFFDVINPTTSEKIARVPAGTKEDIDAVVKAYRLRIPSGGAPRRPVKMLTGDDVYEAPGWSEKDEGHFVNGAHHTADGFSGNN